MESVWLLNIIFISNNGTFHQNIMWNCRHPSCWYAYRVMYAYPTTLSLVHIYLIYLEVLYIGFQLKTNQNHTLWPVFHAAVILFDEWLCQYWHNYCTQYTLLVQMPNICTLLEQITNIIPNITKWENCCNISYPFSHRGAMQGALIQSRALFDFDPVYFYSHFLQYIDLHVPEWV